MEITSCGQPLDLSSRRFGLLRSSAEAAGDPQELQARLDQDGYLFLPQILPLDEVKAARQSVLQALHKENAFDPAFDWQEGRARPGLDMAFRPDLANGSPAIQSLLYSPRMMKLFEEIFGEEALHYDYTWLRAMAPGRSTEPHYDTVYMGRGSARVLTAWTPLSEIPFGHGGLIVLENSHTLEDLKSTYGQMDVDVVCSNKGGMMAMNHKGYHGYGALCASPRDLADQLDRRWLASPFSMGDLLIFTMVTLHASADNHSPFIRLSTDSRYQPAAEPADERWVGAQPMGHGGRVTREMIC